MPDPSAPAKRRKQRTSWHRSPALQKDVALYVMGDIVREILAEGVASKADLHRRLEKALKATVDRDQLDLWLKLLDLSKLFDQKVVIRLPKLSLPEKTGQAFKVMGEGASVLLDVDVDDLDESLPPQMAGSPGNQGSTPPASAASSGADASGGATHGNNGWTPPPDPLAPATVGGRPATVMPLGGAVAPDGDFQ